MIQTIINEPKVLASNSSPITFDATKIRTRCAYCCNGGWLDYENGNPIFKIFGNILAILFGWIFILNRDLRKTHGKIS